MISSIEWNPTSQDDLLNKVSELFGGIAFAALSLLTLFNSGMGSGKSNIMATLPTVLRGFTGILFVLEEHQQLMEQIMKAFRESKSSHKMQLMNSEEHELDSNIRQSLNLSRIPVVFFKNVSHLNGSLSKSAKNLKRIAGLFSSVNKLAFIDEIDKHLTLLTGGINAKLDHTCGIMENSYAGVISQKESLNTFDILRNYNVKCFGFSGTMNNMICSKLPSLGYKKSDISIINVYPIETLYKDLNIISTDVNDINVIGPFLSEAEQMVNKKILMVFPNKRRITEFKKEYCRKYGRQISCVEITGGNTSERETPKWKEEFKNAKYVFGIKLVTTGFDLSTWIEGQEFSLGILYCKLSDKMSYPLSKNAEHSLYMDTAASLMQLLARLRRGGKFLIPSGLDERDLHQRLSEVFDLVKNGIHEYDWVCGIPGVTQEDKQNQGLVIALIQNIKFKKEDRPIVTGILNDLERLTSRDFKKEVKANLETPLSFDHSFWTGWIGCLWNTYLVDFKKYLSEEDKQAEKDAIISNYKRGLRTTSGGLRNERTVDERIKEAIIERSENTCGHCGLEFEESDIPQDCHIKRHDDKGQYTEDNIIRGHSDCDAMIDNHGLIIYNPSGNGVFLKRHAKINVPHRKQLEGISVTNFTARWNWEKNRQGQSHLSDNEFIEYLNSKGYVYKGY